MQRLLQPQRLMGFPYQIYNSVPYILTFLSEQLRIVLKKQIIPRIWHGVGSILMLKEKTFIDLDQFRMICLLNVESFFFYCSSTEIS